MPNVNVHVCTFFIQDEHTKVVHIIFDFSVVFSIWKANQFWQVATAAYVSEGFVDFVILSLWLKPANCSPATVLQQARTLSEDVYRTTWVPWKTLSGRLSVDLLLLLPCIVTIYRTSFIMSSSTTRRTSQTSIFIFCVTTRYITLSYCTSLPIEGTTVVVWCWSKQAMAEFKPFSITSTTCSINPYSVVYEL